MSSAAAGLRPRAALASLLAALGAGAAPTQATQAPTGEACQYADFSADDVDFDENVKARMNPQLDLRIPEGARIGEVRIRRREIFNTSEPDEDNWLFRATNALHPLTDKSTIRAALLFGPGDVYDPDVLEETERALRDKAYLYDAWVAPQRVCGDRVDLVVLTRDMWTLQPTFGFSRSGGSNTTSLGISDDNFLGLGKRLSFLRQEDEERTSFTATYRDPNVGGSRWQLGLQAGETTDGRKRALDVSRPFYKFGARWSAGFDFNDEKRVEEHYFRGNSVAEFQRRIDSYGGYAGLSLNREDSVEQRLLFGYRYREDRFARVTGKRAPRPFPEDRRVSYPWVELQWLENEFFETVNFNKLQRTEDIRSGFRASSEIGWSDDAFGARADRLLLANRMGEALVATEHHFLDYQLSQSGSWRTETASLENLRWAAQGRYYFARQQRRHGWYAELDLSYVQNQTADNRLTLGGDNGLRGYPLRYQTGDRRFLLRLERRYYAGWHLFNLLRAGAVAFFDAGRAWFGGRDNGPNGGVLKDVGLGLRIASSRVEVSRILQIDVAWPLDGARDIDQMQVLIRGSSRF